MAVQNDRHTQPTLAHLLRWRATHEPDRAAFTFLVDGENQTTCLTYGQLDQHVRAIAAALQDSTRPGDRALLLYPSGLDYVTAFLGCLYVGVIAVPAYPPQSLRQDKVSTQRLGAIIRDAQPAVGLTLGSFVTKLAGRFDHTLAHPHLPLLATDAFTEHDGDAWVQPALTEDTVAFLQYTSGSTMAPRGVMVSHSNLLQNSRHIEHALATSSETRGVSWAPLFHDLGLVTGVLQPIYSGFHVTLMSPIHFLQRPIRWLQAISRGQATHSGAPNFAFDLCVRSIPPEQRLALDLSSWSVAYNCAEPVRAETLARFAEAFAPAGFRINAFAPCYGLAEATLGVAMNQAGGEQPQLCHVATAGLTRRMAIVVPEDTAGMTYVSCGTSRPGQQLVIADPESGRRCSAGEIGEIWASGPNIARGYWNKPDQTACTFGAYLQDTGEGPFLRTGDLGFIHNGELFITGRLKDLIIVHGRNHYPQDIVQTVEQSYHGLHHGGGSAFTIEARGEERLVIVQEVEREQRNAPLDAAITAIREAVAEHHELPVFRIVLVKPGSIPRTTSGKIQHHLCKEHFLKGNLIIITTWSADGDDASHQADADPLGLPASTAIAGLTHVSAAEPQVNDTPEAGRSVDRIQRWLIDHVATGARVEPDAIDPQVPFARFGLDSLIAAGLVADLETWLGRRVGVAILSEYPSIAALAQHLALGEGDTRVGGKSRAEIPEQYYRFDRFPEYRALRQRLDELESAGIANPYFQLHDGRAAATTIMNGQELINFANYDYLGMAGDPTVTQAAKDAIDRYGTSVSASRLVAGERVLHRELEQEIAALVGSEASIVYVSGHATNVSTIGHLFGGNDLILYDALIHNSIVLGSQLSGARALPFPHNDWQALDRMLTQMRHQYQRVLVVLEGIYSTDGDIADLPRFVEVKRRHKTFLMVDEAHSIGVLGASGRGVGQHFGLNAADVDLWMGTLSKAFASCGGYIAGAAALIEYLKYTSPGFIFSVGMTPPNTAAALAAIRLLRQEPQRVARLRRRFALFASLARRHGLDIGLTRDSPVVPVIVGDSGRCIRLSHALFARGIQVQPLVAPAVDNHAARLRFFITAKHTDDQIKYTVDAVAEEFARHDVVDEGAVTGAAH